MQHVVMLQLHACVVQMCPMPEVIWSARGTRWMGCSPLLTYCWGGLVCCSAAKSMHRRPGSDKLTDVDDEPSMFL